MKSLILLAFPRSMSSLIASEIGLALKHELPYQPYPASKELLHHTTMGLDWTESYEKRSGKFRQYKIDLNRYSSDGFLKDVHQPYMVAKYLETYSGLYQPLFLQRELTDVTYSIAKAGWWWPILALGRRGRDIYARSVTEWNQHGYLTDYHFAHSLPALVRGLVLTYRDCYASVEHVLRYEDLIQDPNVLWDKLEEMGYEPRRRSYIDNDFVQERERIAARRSTELWNVIAGIVDQVRASL